MSDLKLNQIVLTSKLDLSTVQYVLKHPELLSGMPDAGSQGVHRRFTLPQALRLALCCQLVMSGIPLKHAGPAIDFWHKQVREQRKKIEGHHLGKFTGLYEHAIDIFDRELLTIRYAAVYLPNGETSMYSITRRRIIRKRLGPTISKLTIDVGRLGLAFSAVARA